ncbi:DUF5701 family protein [Demequina iriomotensis]|uniref:DUF5701 family protein n=1 Tax=Demequina iriomotensis TaxID=1536641 RepID=UPI000781DAAA|nr:DUF5701 family protein [Demequina iriomotensis]
MTASPLSAVATLPPLARQAELLIDRGLAALAGISPDQLRAVARDDAGDGLLVVSPAALPPSALAPHLRLGDRAGFVVTDMTDVDEFAPIGGVEVPEALAYVLRGIDRGDEMANWSPDEALPAIVGAGRTPLTLAEGIHWVLQQPNALERNRCFMTIGSRKPKVRGGLDSRTPALWISNGTGRDGAANRHAPKVGWCWAGNRHTWLGFASAASREPLG